jgi:NADP-dependent 3-hydroxy acid dehydrogenase YdfG/uncharacterized protein YndB with AHSA1/START domain
VSERVAIVAGAGGELGRETAAVLAAAGFSVVGVDRNEQGLKELPDGIRYEVGDPTDPAAARVVVDRIAADVGAPEVLVNTIGTYHLGEALTATPEDLRVMVDVNVGAALWLTQAVAPYLRERGAGAVVHVSSRPGLEPTAGMATYGVSKAALSHLTRVLDLELRPSGIRVNARYRRRPPVGCGLRSGPDGAPASGRVKLKYRLDFLSSAVKVKCMLKHEAGAADRVFHALADANRRAVVERLTRGPATVSELAGLLGVTLAATGPAPAGAAGQRAGALGEGRPGPHLPARPGRPAQRRGVAASPAHGMGAPPGPPGHAPRQPDPRRDEGARIMTEHSVKHSTFTLERTYPAPPAAVFAAWSDRDTKATWIAPSDDHYTLDFRIGGTESVHGPADTGLVARSRYHDIVPGERIVYSTALSTGAVLSTVSLTTVRFAPDGDGTRLVLTEQGTFLDDQEHPEWREQGTSDWLDTLGRSLR